VAPLSPLWPVDRPDQLYPLARQHQLYPEARLDRLYPQDPPGQLARAVRQVLPSAEFV
jgi:hypothetical protein